jgi:DNA-binding NtrC family response regulator
LTLQVEEIFRRYSWPGNVRELRNVIERVMILEDSDLITSDWLPRGLVRDEHPISPPVVGVSQAPEVAAPSFQLPFTQSFQLPEEGIDLEQVELSLVRQAMERSGGNQTRAAELLGVSRDQLRYRLKKIGESQPEQ